MDSAESSSGNDRALAYALLRGTLGLNILMHGLMRIFTGPAAFAANLEKMFQQTPLASWQVHSFGLALPWIEAALGLMLLLGFGTRLALALGAVWIAVLMFGVSLRQDWAVAGMQLTYAAIYAALLALRTWNRYSVDEMLARNRV